MAQDEKLIDKLKKIKAHADSAEKIGNEEEAYAFAAMLQKLLAKHNLDMSQIEWEEKKQQATNPIRGCITRVKAPDVGSHCLRHRSSSHRK